MFGEYHIRSTEITNTEAFAIGWAIATYFNKTSYLVNQTQGFRQGKPTIIVAMDAREKSAQLAEQLQAGLLKNAHVVFIGKTATPVMQFVVNTVGATAGVSVTGANSPEGYNGFKIARFKAPFTATEITAVKNLAMNTTTAWLDNLPDVGDYRTTPGEDMYVNAMVRRFKHLNNNHVTVAIDGSNSVGGLLLNRILRKLNIKTFPINTRLEKNFPNHTPDPCNPANLEQLQDEVIATNADIGYMLDGDATSIAVIDHVARNIHSDKLIWLVAKANFNRFAIPQLQRILTSNSPQQLNEAIILGPRTSNFLWNTLKHELGVQVHICKAGTNNIQNKMLNNNAMMGAEINGTFSYGAWNGACDAIYSAMSTIQFAELASTIVAKYPNTHATREIRVPMPEHAQEQLIILLAESFRKHRRFKVDGIRFYGERNEWWLNVRKAKSEKAISIRAEAVNKNQLQNIVQYTNQCISQLMGDN